MTKYRKAEYQRRIRNAEWQISEFKKHGFPEDAYQWELIKDQLEIELAIEENRND